METKNIPFFARKVQASELVVKTGVRAGAAESLRKRADEELAKQR